jgi:hypothetical protein
MSLTGLLYAPIELIYILVQHIIIYLFKPPPPTKSAFSHPKGRVAVVGAGLSGVSAAAWVSPLSSPIPLPFQP